MEVVAPQIATPATHAIHAEIVQNKIVILSLAKNLFSHAAAQIHAETLAEIAQTLAEIATAAFAQTDFAKTAFAQIVIQSEAKNLFVAALSAILARATLSTQRPTNQIFPLDVFAAHPSFILR